MESIQPLRRGVPLHWDLSAVWVGWPQRYRFICDFSLAAAALHLLHCVVSLVSSSRTLLGCLVSTCLVVLDLIRTPTTKLVLVLNK